MRNESQTNSKLPSAVRLHNGTRLSRAASEPLSADSMNVLYHVIFLQAASGYSSPYAIHGHLRRVQESKTRGIPLLPRASILKIIYLISSVRRSIYLLMPSISVVKRI